MTDAQELKPCPFCGCTDADRTELAGLVWHVCNWCDAHGPVEGQADGIRYGWNARVAPTLAEALNLPEVREMVEAVAWMQRAARNTFTLRTADYHDETCRCMRCAEDAVFAALAKLPKGGE